MKIRTPLKWISNFFVALVCMLAANANAAQLSFQRDKDSALILVIEGEIRKGDDSKFIELIRADVNSYYSASRIHINSPGGDVEAAMKLAKLIEESGMNLRVDDGSICASACFLLYVSAPLRMARPGSRLIVHRPYYDMSNTHGSTQAQSAVAYQEAILSMRDYLVSRAVSGHLIDKMMQMPSSQGYALSIEDLVSLNLMSAPVQEYAIQKCGYVSASAPGSIECIKDYFRGSRHAFVAKYVHGQDSQSATITSLAMEEFNNWLRLKESTDPNFREKARKVSETIVFDPDIDLESRIRAYKDYYESL